MSSPYEHRARLDKPRHVKYWRRCVKTLLPTQYTSNDSNRMYLAFLMIGALDLLDILDEVCTAADKQDFIEWIYHCQHPQGGFRAWPGTDFGMRANELNAIWDPANIPATYFALTTLLILGDDMRRVRRAQTLRWLTTLQREDGSFGETIVDGCVEGGRDPRFSYCATGVRYILRCNNLTGTTPDTGIDSQNDVDIEKLVRCIKEAQSYEGGVADEAYGEPHAGYNFCSLGTLHYIGRFPTSVPHNFSSSSDQIDIQQVLRWLAHRQTTLIDPDDVLDNDLEAGQASSQDAPSHKLNDLHIANLHQDPHTTIYDPITLANPFTCAGMNGRANKIADTCYAWWSTASLHLLGQPAICNQDALTTFLIEQTQHPLLGGFGKCAGDLPDVYHSYMGLAALGLMGHTGVKKVDAAMCISEDAKARLPSLWNTWDQE